MPYIMNMFTRDVLSFPGAAVPSRCAQPLYKLMKCEDHYLSGLNTAYHSSYIFV